MTETYSSPELLPMPATLQLVEELRLLASLAIAFRGGSEL
jgi:hypothetical protein